MPASPVRVLLIDDDEEDHLFVRALLSRQRTFECALDWAPDYERGLEALVQNEVDVCLLDYCLGRHTGLDLLREAQRRGSHVPMILLTGQGGRELDLEAMRDGAADYLPKEQLDVDHLERSVRFAVERGRALRTLRERGQELELVNAGLTDAHRRLEESHVQLLQQEKMASLGQLVAGIAHEINNPLAFVLNNVYLVIRDLERSAGEWQQRLEAETVRRLETSRTLLRDVQLGVERVRDLVTKLRAFSRLDAEAFSTIDVAAAVDVVLLFLKHRIKDRIAVAQAYCADNRLACYAGQINQVLMNVIANAVDATPEGGTITLRTARDARFLTITVQDTGPGMPPEVRARIFEPFFTTKPVGEGTGMGLAIAYGIVRQHQGTITVQSEPGQGATFEIRLPVNLTAPATAAAEPGPIAGPAAGGTPVE